MRLRRSEFHLICLLMRKRITIRVQAGAKQIIHILAEDNQLALILVAIQSILIVCRLVVSSNPTNFLGSRTSSGHCKLPTASNYPSIFGPRFAAKLHRSAACAPKLMLILMVMLMGAPALVSAVERTYNWAPLFPLWLANAPLRMSLADTKCRQQTNSISNSHGFTNSCIVIR